jgi:hypothetical protein
MFGTPAGHERMKYIHNLIRPISYIRSHIDPAWGDPLPVTTPPFPDYTSGHSIQSAAAAEVLAATFGEVAFTDHTHDGRGLAPRSLGSFAAFAQERPSRACTAASTTAPPSSAGSSRDGGWEPWLQPCRCADEAPTTARQHHRAHCSMMALCVACRDGIGDVGSVSPYSVNLLG